MRRFYQIDPLIKYLIPVHNVSSPGLTLSSPLDVSYSAFETNIPYSTITNISSAAGISSIATIPYFIIGSTLSLGQQYLDTGRRVTLYGTNTAGAACRTATYTQVIQINGPSTEGITAIGNNVYVKTWAANGQNVVVCRNGP